MGVRDVRASKKFASVTLTFIVHTVISQMGRSKLLRQSLQKETGFHDKGTQISWKDQKDEITPKK